MPITASQTLIKLFISFPHRVHSKRCSLSETGLQMLMLCDGVFHSPHETRSSRYFLLAQVDSETVYLTPVILFHSSWRFVSPLHSCSTMGKKAWGLLSIVYQLTPYLLLSLRTVFGEIFFFWAGKKILWRQLGVKKINKGNDIDVCVHTVVFLIPKEVLLGLEYHYCPPEIFTVHFFAWQQADVSHWTRSYHGFYTIHYCFCWEKNLLTVSSGSSYHFTWSCLSF